MKVLMFKVSVACKNTPFRNLHSIGQLLNTLFNDYIYWYFLDDIAPIF